MEAILESLCPPELTMGFVKQHTAVFSITMSICAQGSSFKSLFLTIDNLEVNCKLNATTSRIP